MTSNVNTIENENHFAPIQMLPLHEFDELHSNENLDKNINRLMVFEKFGNGFGAWAYDEYGDRHFDRILMPHEHTVNIRAFEEMFSSF